MRFVNLQPLPGVIKLGGGRRQATPTPPPGVATLTNIKWLWLENELLYLCFFWDVPFTDHEFGFAVDLSVTVFYDSEAPITKADTYVFGNFVQGFNDGDQVGLDFFVGLGPGPGWLGTGFHGVRVNSCTITFENGETWELPTQDYLFGDGIIDDFPTPEIEF